MSVIDRSGNYIGGVILPGLKVSLDSLSGKTAQLPYISLETPGKVIGKNTIDCMRSGIMHGKRSYVRWPHRPDGGRDWRKSHHHRHRRTRQTGNRATPLCHHSIDFEEDLLLKGLLTPLTKKNKK